MKHLGDITKISGHEAPVVDCIIGGSPCQGLSQAGKRAGLEDERSGLFIEQVRIIKEMREEDERNGRSGVDIRPRYMVWENVPGSLSSPGKDRAGEDFRCVLEEVARIVEEGVTIPRPPKGKWSNTGVIVGDGYSIAWRIMDAQYFGVPQRRRRIALVADFGGYNAPRIVFGEGESHGSTVRDRAESSLRHTGGESRPEVQSVSEGLPRDTYKSKQTREGTPYAPQGSIGADDREGEGLDCYNQALTGDKSKTLSNAATDSDLIPCVVYALDRASFNQGKNAQYDFEVSDNGVNSPIVAKGPGAVCYIKSGGFKELNSAKARSDAYEEEIAPSLAANKHDACVAISLQSNSAHSLNGNNVVRTRYIVRRLTPLECERLQGFPDYWTSIGEYTDGNGKRRKTSDANRYKALGNSIALPPWKTLLRRLCAFYERDATMASLFDGIGGFPLLWEQINGKGSCLWASEIEEFPIAVTKERIGE